MNKADYCIKLIYCIGKGVTLRTRMYVFFGINYKRMTQLLDELVEKGYVLKIPREGVTGVRPARYALTDKGVKFYRVINEYWDVLGKNINSLQFL